MLPFERSEYQARIARTRQLMSERRIDTLIVSDPCNMVYLVGYDASTYYVPQLLAVSLHRDEPIWIGREQDVTGARQCSILSDDSIVGWPEPYVDSRGEHAVAWMSRVLRDRGLGRGVIGVEMDSFYYTARQHAEFTHALGNARFVDADLLVNELRLVKSEAEIGYVRQAARIAERAMSAAIDAVRVGVRGCDVAAAAYAAQATGAEGHGGDYVAVQPLVVTGERTATPHLGWTDVPIGNDEAGNIELAGCRYRYHAALARTVFVGTPPARLVDLSKAVNDALDAALAVIRPGIRAEEYEAAFRRALAPSGYEKPSRIGYPIGIGYPPNWGERSVSFRPGDTTVLAPNMTFHTIPGMWLGDHGYEVSTTFRVTETGVEEITQFPRQLFVKG